MLKIKGKQHKEYKLFFKFECTTDGPDFVKMDHQECAAQEW